MANEKGFVDQVFSNAETNKANQVESGQRRKLTQAEFYAWVVQEPSDSQRALANRVLSKADPETVSFVKHLKSKGCLTRFTLSPLIDLLHRLDTLKEIKGEEGGGVV